jgi:hypothetical protein
MPKGASSIALELYLRVLLLGPPKSGKSVAAITTAPREVLVINGDEKNALTGPIKLWVRRDGGRGAVPGDEFDVINVRSWLGMEKALDQAGLGVKKGKYKTVVLDLLNGYASRLEQELSKKTENEAGEPDGRRFWPEYRKRLKNMLTRLFALDAHVIVTSHYDEDDGATIDGQAPKHGPGIVPLIGGKARREIGGMFQDVIFLEKRGKKRVFLTDIEGVWGPGCRSLAGRKEKELPARIDALIETFGIKGGKKITSSKPSALAPAATTKKGT